MIRRLLLAALAATALLASLIVVRTARYSIAAEEVAPGDAAAVDRGAAGRLAGALRFATIAHADPSALDRDAFAGLHRYLEQAFPRVHATLRRETVQTHSLLYTWPGRDASLRPILLLGHLDVVPVEPGTEGAWEHPPFGGVVADGFIWGRGAIDNKSTVLGTLEAVEMLLGDGFVPRRTVYLAFGHDEEVGGGGGAREIAAVLASQNLQFEMVLDEGGVIGEGLLSGVAAPVALVGIAEKGFATIELTVRGDGGHSSLPPRPSTIGILSAAVARLEAEQMPARIDGATRQLFDTLAPRLPFLQRAVFANLWLAHPLAIRRLEAGPTTNAMIRTTTAPTVFQAGTKDNVLPSVARAVINFRILPGDSVAAVVEHVRRVVNDDRVAVAVAGAFSAEPSAISSSSSESYRLLSRTIRSVIPEAIVAPYLVVVVTDARHYAGLSRDLFRFLPLQMTAADLSRMHGTNERVAVAEYERAVRLYRQLLRNASS